ncbi:MAG TPA: phosphate ABC transporter ATP-binding protein [Acidimicrobiales bacterium]|nr:phosphate ABC transporter ATP-binding protein [Acidimicrobiales bacterium]
MTQSSASISADSPRATDLRAPNRPSGAPADADSPSARVTKGESAATSEPQHEREALVLKDVSVSFDGRLAVKNVSVEVPGNRVTAFVGPSGCGKTTLLRAINRLHDQGAGVVRGSLHLGELDLYGPDVRPEIVRSRIGMVFQRPNPFPTMSIYENAIAGLRLNGVRQKWLLREAAEDALRRAALWDLVKDRLREPAIRLSGGQQQRLCIARALAVEPDVLLMDEPCSSLDPVATGKIEALMADLSTQITIVLVTHNMFQASRVSDFAAVFLLDDDRVGELVEFGPTRVIFHDPSDPRTRSYVEGKIG